MSRVQNIRTVRSFLRGSASLNFACDAEQYSCPICHQLKEALLAHLSPRPGGKLFLSSGLGTSHFLCQESSAFWLFMANTLSFIFYLGLTTLYKIITILVVAKIFTSYIETNPILSPLLYLLYSNSYIMGTIIISILQVKKLKQKRLKCSRAHS